MPQILEMFRRWYKASTLEAIVSKDTCVWLTAVCTAGQTPTAPHNDFAARFTSASGPISTLYHILHFTIVGMTVP